MAQITGGRPFVPRACKDPTLFVAKQNPMTESLLEACSEHLLVDEWDEKWGFSQEQHLKMLTTAIRRVQENHRSHLKKLNSRRQRGLKKWGGPSKSGFPFQEPILSLFDVPQAETEAQELLSQL